MAGLPIKVRSKSELEGVWVKKAVNSECTTVVEHETFCQTPNTKDLTYDWTVYNCVAYFIVTWLRQ